MNTLSIHQDESLKKYVIGSVVFHVCVVAFFSIKAVFFSGQPIDYQAAIKVDLIALPDKADPNLIEASIPTKEEKPLKTEKIDINKAEVKPAEKPTVKKMIVKEVGQGIGKCCCVELPLEVHPHLIKAKWVVIKST